MLVAQFFFLTRQLVVFFFVFAVKSGEDYTKITFKPDFGKFKMDGFDDDTIALLTRRVYDLAGCTDRSLKVCVFV